MSDSKARSYIALGIFVWPYVAAGWLSPAIARHTGLLSNDVEGICVLSFLAGLYVTGHRLRAKPFPWYKRFILWLSLPLLAIMWPLLGSRTWAQMSADIARHPSVSIACALVFFAAGIAVVLAVQRLWHRPPVTRAPHDAED